MYKLYIGSTLHPPPPPLGNMGKASTFPTENQRDLKEGDHSVCISWPRWGGGGGGGYPFAVESTIKPFFSFSTLIVFCCSWLHSRIYSLKRTSHPANYVTGSLHKSNSLTFHRTNTYLGKITPIVQYISHMAVRLQKDLYSLQFSVHYCIQTSFSEREYIKDYKFRVRW